MIKIYFIILMIAVNLLSNENVLAQGNLLGNDSNVYKDNYSIRLEKGIAQIKTDDLSAAMETFNAILNQDPDQPEANFRMGIIYMRQKQYNEGIEHLKKAVLLDPENISYHMTLANAYEFRKLYSQAIPEYEKVTELTNPGSDDGKESRKKIDYLKATMYATEGKIDKALPIFVRLSKDFQDDALIQYSLGLAYLFNKELDKSKRIFTELIKLTPEDQNIYLNLATIYEQQGELVNATDNLRKVIEISPQGKLAQQAQERLDIIEGKLFMREGNLQEALDILSGVIKKSPDNISALFALAEVHQLMGQLGKSEEAFSKVIKILPNHLEARLRLAGIYVETNRLNEGIKELQEIINLGNGTPQAQKATELLDRLKATREESMDETQRLQQAQERYQEIIISDPENIEAHYNLGRIYYRQGKLQDARKELEEVVRLNPDNKQGQIALAALYDELGMYDLAIDKYSTIIALEQDQKNADRFKELIEVASAKKLYAEGNLGLAREKFEGIVAEYPNNALAYFYLGLIHSSEEDLSKAVDAYEEVIRLVPGHTGARLNLAINFERLHREEDAISQYRKILEAGPPVNIAEAAQRRLIAAEKRLRGLSTGMSYSMTADTNSNLSNTNPTEEYRSDLSLNISYQYKLNNGVRIRFVTSPTYSTYHVGEYDFLNTSSSISATMFPAKYTLVGGFTIRTNRGLVTSSRYSDSQVLFGEGATRLNLPQVLSPFSGDNVMSDVSLNLSYSDFESNSSPFFSAFTYSAGIGVSQPLGDRSSINLGYNYTFNENKYDDNLSNDYAYNSHGINVGFEWLVSPKISANNRYGISLLNYSNPDSGTQFTEYRKNTRYSISLGGSYRFHENIRFFANLSWVVNDSNLPVGFVLDAQDIIEGQQSSSLGEYSKGTFTMGMNLFI